MKDLVLDLCGGSGAWSRPYREAGYDVVLIDPFSAHPDALLRDVRLVEAPPRNVRGILAAPPCTHLAGSGARWWAGKGDAALLEALSIVDACLRLITVAQPAWWVIENPVGRLSRFLGKPQLIFDPWEYGHPTIKRTCLWGSFTEPLRTPVEPTAGQVVWRMAPSHGSERAPIHHAGAVRGRLLPSEPLMGVQTFCDVCRFMRPGIVRYSLQREVWEKIGDRRGRHTSYGAGSIDMCNECWERIGKPRTRARRTSDLVFGRPA